MQINEYIDVFECLCEYLYSCAHVNRSISWRGSCHKINEISNRTKCSLSCRCCLVSWNYFFFAKYVSSFSSAFIAFNSFLYCRFYYDVLRPDPVDNISLCLFRADSHSLNTARHVSTYCFALFGLIVPLIIIAILYGLIIKVLRRNAKGKQVARGKKRVTKMISAVISSFVICWTPMQIYLLYTHHGHVIAVFAIISQSLVYISACINPILYAFLSEPFRKAFQEFLTCSKLISNYFLSHHGLELDPPRRNSAYRVVQQHSLTRKLSLSPGQNERTTRKSLINNDQYCMDEFTTDTLTTRIKSSDQMSYNPLSNVTTPSDDPWRRTKTNIVRRFFSLVVLFSWILLVLCIFFSIYYTLPTTYISIE